jgi:hypothetical protein
MAIRAKGSRRAPAPSTLSPADDRRLRRLVRERGAIGCTPLPGSPPTKPAPLTHYVQQHGPTAGRRLHRLAVRDYDDAAFLAAVARQPPAWFALQLRIERTERAQRRIVELERQQAAIVRAITEARRSLVKLAA